MSEIDGHIWTVPADRVKGTEGRVQPFRVPLSAEAQEVARIAAEVSPDILFPSPSGATFITDQALNKKLRKMHVAATVHGFRTSFRSWVQDTDACAWEVAETILGHQVGGRVERSYARSDLLERRAPVMEAWARFVTGAESADVVPIRG
jgi:integrase